MACLHASSALAQGAYGVRSELKKAPVVLAGVQAAYAFANDFKQAHKRDVKNEFVGFHAQLATSEAVVSAYNVLASGQTAKDLYACQYQFDAAGVAESAQCANAGQQEVMNYSASPKGFSVAEFETSAVEAITLFEKKIGNPRLIEKAKFWRAGSNIQVSLKWTPAGQNEQASYLMCHYHGSHIDCHGQSRPGPNEPQE